MFKSVHASRNKKLIAQPRLFTLWKNLHFSSALCELYRDDTHIIHYSSLFKGNEDMIGKPSSMLDDKVFFAALDFAANVFQAEEKLLGGIIKDPNRLQLLFTSFSTREGLNTLVSKRILAGVERNMGNYFKMGVWQSKKDMKAQLDGYTKALKKDVGILEEQLFHATNTFGLN